MKIAKWLIWESYIMMTEETSTVFVLEKGWISLPGLWEAPQQEIRSLTKPLVEGTLKSRPWSSGSSWIRTNTQVVKFLQTLSNCIGKDPIRWTDYCKLSTSLNYGYYEIKMFCGVSHIWSKKFLGDWLLHYIWAEK